MNLFGFNQPLPPNCEELPGYDFKYKWHDIDDEVQHEDVGYIRYVLDRGNGFFEFYMDARSGYTFIVGPKVGGYFCCITAEGKSSELASFSDLFWNKERLGGILSAPDAAAIAYALYELHKIWNRFPEE